MQSAEVSGFVIQPILWLVLFGVGMASLVTTSGTGEYIGFMAPGIIALSALGGATAGGAVWQTERLRGMVREYLVAPIPKLSILGGNVASTVTKGLIQGIIIFVVSLLMGATLSNNPINLIGGLAAALLFTIGFSGIALAFASLTDSPGGFHTMILLLNLPLLFASNALYPIKILPTWLQIVAYANPTTYAISGIRDLVYKTSTFPGSDIALWIDFVVLFAFAILGLLFSQYAFKKSLP